MRARDLDETQIRDVRHNTSAIGVEEHHLHFGTNLRRCGHGALNLRFLADNREHSIHNFIGSDAPHAAKINWAFAEKTGATFNVVSHDRVSVAERPSQTRLRGAKNGDYRHAQ